MSLYPQLNYKKMKSYKKIILTLIVALCGMGVANAQFRFGVKAGLNMNSLHINNLEDNFNKDNHCGYTLGVMTEFQVPIIGLAFDLSAMYTRMNSDLDAKAPEDENVSYNKNFLEIPLNLKYKIGLPLVGSIITPYVFTGPSFAIKLDKNSLDAIKTKTCQVAWNVGLGVELVKHLQISGSYGFGMNNVAKFTGLVNTETVKVKNNYWTVTAAWLF
jgi:hypothetical protein